MCSQSHLDGLGCNRLSASLLESCVSNEERAAFIASQTPLSRGWLTVLPIPQVGTVIDDASFRIGVCLRLAVPPCVSDRCSRCSRVVNWVAPMACTAGARRVDTRAIVKLTRLFAVPSARPISPLVVSPLAYIPHKPGRMDSLWFRGV